MPRIQHMIVGAICLLATAGISAAAQPRLPGPRSLDRFGLERVWWGQALLNSQRDQVTFVTADEEQVYIQASSGTVTAFDAQTGKRLWAVQRGRRDSPGQPPISNDKLVLVISGIDLFAFDKWSGELLWEIRMPKIPSTSPTIDDDRVYVGALDGSVYAFNLETIDELYNERKLPKWSQVAVDWRFKTSKQVTTPPISTQGRVLFASLDNSLYAVDADSRTQLLQFETDAPVSAPLGHDGDYLFMASEDFNLYCINLNNGGVRWQARTGLPVRKAPRIVGEHVMVMPMRGGMHYLTADTGEQRWWRPEVTDFVSASLDVVYASDKSGNVMIIDRVDGAPLGAVPLRGFDIRVPNDRTDRLYLGTTSGLIVCLREQGLEFPLYHRYPERRPILPEFAPEEGEQIEEEEMLESDPADPDAATPDDEPPPPDPEPEPGSEDSFFSEPDSN